jgi:3-dehydroquinate synthase
VNIEFVENSTAFFSKFANRLNRTFILCDSNTSICAQELYLDIPIIEIPDGEIYKNLNSCEVVWHKLMELGANRNSHLICVGGGVICDLGAFVASLFMRGISYSLIPTSLLAMVDASIGGKTGVNFRNHKNYIGVFSEAEKTYIYPDFLKTLPTDEWLNGYAEMMKHGLINSDKHFENIMNQVHNHYAQIPNIEILQETLAIKNEIVTNDKFEKEERKKLNFGHTIGHAIETVGLNQDLAISHGRAVLLGIIGESFLSHIYSTLSAEALRKITDEVTFLLKDEKIYLSSDEDIFDQMTFDKKNHLQTINFTLLEHIGHSKIDFELTENEIMPALAFIRNAIN